MAQVNITGMLQKAITQRKQANDVKTFAQEFSKELAGVISPDAISRNVEVRISNALIPLLSKLAERDEFTTDAISRAIITAIQNVRVEVPEIKMPVINVPRPEVNVTVPPIKIPDIVLPEEMQTRGWLNLIGWDQSLLSNPIPVQLRGADGSPIRLFENLTQIVSGGGGGGKHDYFTIKKIEGTLDVRQGSDIVNSVNVLQIAGTNTAVNSGVANDGTLRVVHATDVGMSVNVTNTVTVSATDLDVRDLASATDNVSAYQVSGHRWSTEATQSGTWNITTVTTVNSAVAYLTNADGSYRGTMPVEGTISVSGAITSTVATGPTPVDAGDDGSAPVQVGGIARTANPTAVTAGDVVKATHDDLGRQVMRPVQVRDLIVTAYVQLSNGTETTLLAATAGAFHDLVYIMGANNSGVAVSVDIRPVTAGNVIMTIQIPANGTAGVSSPVPLPQSASDTGNNWTADLPDITGTTVSLTALFTREV